MKSNNDTVLCKSYYAASAKVNVPQKISQECLLLPFAMAIYALCWHWLLKISLDILLNKGIIYLTIIPLNTGDCHGCEKELKNSSSTRARIAQFSTTKRNGQNFFWKRIFRSSRPCSGKVRDASPCRSRRPHGCQCSIDIWFFPGGFLSDQSIIRTGRIAGIDIQTPRAKAWTQNYRYSSRFYRQVHWRRQNIEGAGIIKADSKTVRFFSPPAQYRTCLVAASKKTALNNAPVVLDANCSQWALRYEQLRKTALSGYSCNGGNWGMALFIRHGMVGWMRAWPTSDTLLSTPKYLPSMPIASQTLVPSSLRDQITILLANIVLNSQKEVAL